MSTETAQKINGYVYFFRSAETGRTKIGKSRWPGNRIDAIRSHVPDVKSIGCIGSDRPLWLERFMHRAFAHLRAHGEWFTLGPAELALADALPDYVSKPSDLPVSLLLLWANNTATLSEKPDPAFGSPAVRLRVMLLNALAAPDDPDAFTAILLPLLDAELERQLALHGPGVRDLVKIALSP